MSLVDKLLQLDAGKLLDLPTKEVKIDRLSALTGEDFLVTCKAITGQQFSDIQKMSVDMNSKGGVKNIKLYDMQVLTILDGVVEPNLRDKKLMDHFGVITPKELVNKLFLSGEIAELSKVINTLSGYDNASKDEEEIKN